MAGMIVKGLGCAHRPWSVTPQFFANNPLDLLCRAGRRAERLHRCTLGRTRDEAYPDGGDLWFQGLALAVCAQAGLALRGHHLATTSVALRGAYVPDRDVQAMTLTDGDAKDHRPDLKPAVLERLVSPDGGVPCGSKRWAGPTSDIKGFQERAQALVAAFQQAPSPRDRSADATLSPEDQAPHLPTLGLITRIPHTLGAVSQGSAHALAWDTWHPLDDNTRDQGLA